MYKHALLMGFGLCLAYYAACNRYNQAELVVNSYCSVQEDNSEYYSQLGIYPEHMPHAQLIKLQFVIQQDNVKRVFRFRCYSWQRQCTGWYFDYSNSVKYSDWGELEPAEVVHADEKMLHLLWPNVGSLVVNLQPRGYANLQGIGVRNAYARINCSDGIRQ